MPTIAIELPNDRPTPNEWLAALDTAQRAALDGGDPVGASLLLKLKIIIGSQLAYSGSTEVDAAHRARPGR